MCQVLKRLKNVQMCVVDIVQIAIVQGKNARFEFATCKMGSVGFARCEVAKDKLYCAALKLIAKIK